MGTQRRRDTDAVNATYSKPVPLRHTEEVRTILEDCMRMRKQKEVTEEGSSPGLRKRINTFLDCEFANPIPRFLRSLLKVIKLKTYTKRGEK